MSNVARVAGQAANTLSKPLQVEDVFSTYLYKGTGADQTITNGIDLAGEGGLVWVKGRSGTAGSSAWGGDIGHNLFDSTAPQKPLNSALNNARTNFGAAGVNFTGTGFTVGYNGYNDLNYSSFPYVSWSFRKAEKFFDIVTYTGDGTTNRQISHNLGSAPGCIIVKRTNALKDWAVYHRSTGNTHYAALNTSETFYDWHTWWQDTDPTSTNFTVGNSAFVNANGDTYVAYIFAHNDGDGDFGPDGNADIIKCGSVSYNAGATVDLGFEPQWVLIKPSSSAGNWILNDVMRGMPSGSSGPRLDADTSGGELANATVVYPTSTGFTMPAFLYNPTDLIYIAIRRPTAVPESATDVFGISYAQDENTVPFPVDFMLTKANGVDYTKARDRLRGGTKYLLTSTTHADLSGTDIGFDDMTGTGLTGWGTSFIHYNWKRAPNFFDVVAYEGTGSVRTVSHNLGVAPEMMWIKRRDSTGTWCVYHTGLDASSPEDYFLYLDTQTPFNNANMFNDTAPTSSVFTVNNNSNSNTSGGEYIAYLFATVAGVSKVGSYTGNGSSQTINCGFTSGARFILIKRTDSTGDWYIWDTERGIVAGNDPHLSLNTNASQVTTNDSIDPVSSGFAVNQVAATNVNVSSAEYIFYAIA